MEEFLPGLVRIMEERLGKFGRPLSIAVILAIVFGVIAWMIGLVSDNIVSPLTKFISTIIGVRPFTLEDFVKLFVTPLAVYVVLLIILSILVQKFFSRKIAKERNKVEGLILEAKNGVKQWEEAKSQAEEQVRISKDHINKVEELLHKIKETPQKND